MKLIFGTSKWEMWDDPLELVAFINGHTGRDIFDFQENVQIFQRLTELSANSGIPILVETHRGRPTYSAIETGKYLEALPELRLTADFSHWIVVHKSGLEDQQANLELAISRADYVHARVGYAEGAINLRILSP